MEALISQPQISQIFSTNDLVEGVLREYLTRNALDGTLKAFDVERPRGPQSVSSRTALRRSLALERLHVKVNKQQSTPTLELWVLYQQIKLAAAADAAGQQLTGASSAVQVVTTQQLSQPEFLTESQQPVAAASAALALRPLANCLSDLQQAGSCDVSHKVPALHEQQQRHPAIQQSTASAASTTAVIQPSQQQSDLTLQDIEDDLDAQSGVASSSYDAYVHTGVSQHVQPALPHSTKPVSRLEMSEMRQLLFGRQGSGSQLPWPAWKQGFFFCCRPGLSFGLVQQQGGPCGLLAAMQAHVVAAIMTQHRKSKFDLSPEQQSAVLATALASAVWQASDGCSAKVVCCSQLSTEGLSFDHLCNSATQLSCTSKLEVEAAFRQQLWQFQEHNAYGLLLMLFSLLLTHSVRQTKEDMDEPDTCFIAAHGYCSQDLVNLVLTGHAVTNGFDGEQDVAGQQCKGIQQQSQLGFLSLFEWYGYTQVGSYLKDPALPIWVVCSESHFTILFAIDSSQAIGNHSGSAMLPKLMYYDGLANQEQPIMLQQSSKHLAKSEVGDRNSETWQQQQQQQHLDSGNALVSPLEHVVHTRWPKAIIEWTGSDPIL